jgi:hypothetical protein
MKSLHKIFIVVLTAAGLLFSCSKEFLEPEPVTSYFQDNFYVTDDQMFEALIAAYDPLQWAFYDGLWIPIPMMGDIKSDNARAGGSNEGDQVGWQQIDDQSNDENTGESLAIWKRNYQGIYRSNLIINAELDSDTTKIYKAEAMFLRAWYYFDLLRTFGPVPVVTITDFPEDYKFVRGSRNEVNDLITGDLRAAIPTLREEWTGAFTGRITKGAALAVLGKVYLYKADWDNDNPQYFDSAAYYLKQVKSLGDQGIYELVSEYSQIWEYRNENTKESVFEIQHSELSFADWTAASGEHMDGNLMIQLCGVRGLKNHSEYTAGWGFMLPTQELYDFFMPEDSIRRNASIITEQDLLNDGASWNKSDHNPNDYTGMWQKKYANFSEYQPTTGDPNVNKDRNMLIIRYADVLLMLAEAAHRGSNEVGVDKYALVDMVRARALDHDNDGIYKTSAQLEAELGSFLEVIWYERRAELALEGDRWFDLVRSGRANSDKLGPNFGPEDMYLPCHAQETNASGGTITTFPDEMN